MVEILETTRLIRKAEQREKQLPAIDLLPPIPHGGGFLDMAVFGPNTYRNNIKSMQRRYFHSSQFPNISFTPATTSESISAAAYGFDSKGEVDFKRDIFDPKLLQAGYIVRTQDGVFTNTQLTDEKTLKQLLDRAEKVNGIYLLENGVGFAPYETFERGVQYCDTFNQGGLARVLEHSPEKTAKKLGEIASPKFYKRGVNVWGFDEVKEPVLRVAGLYSGRGLGRGRLGVGGSDRGGGDNGYVFGVLK